MLHTHGVSSSGGAPVSGPWPEPDADASITGSAHLDTDAQGEPTDGGSKGVALAVAVLNVGVLLTLPVLIVIGVYTFLTIYAVVKALSEGSDAADPATVLIGVVGLVTFFTTLLGVGAGAIGRAADPKKRRSR